MTPGTTNKSGSALPIIGEGDHTYEVHHDWGDLPSGIRYGNTHGVVEDSSGFIYVHHTVHASSESSDSMVVFDAKGRFVRSWGKELRGGAHGLHIQKEGKDEFLYLCDIQRNIVVKATLQGEEVFTLGYPAESPHYQPDAEGKPPSYRPTNLCIGPNGDNYVADGYGSSYILQYDKSGKFIRSFGGGKTKDPGSLNVPHGIWLDSRGAEPLLLTADRSNNRLQYFTLEGKHHSLVHEADHFLPCHFSTFRNGDMVIPDLGARVVILNKHNEFVAILGDDHESKWRETRVKTRDAFLPGKFVCPHGACFDHDGNIFVVEWVEIGRVTKLRKVS